MLRPVGSHFEYNSQLPAGKYWLVLDLHLLQTEHLIGLSAVRKRKKIFKKRDNTKLRYKYCGRMLLSSQMELFFFGSKSLHQLGRVFGTLVKKVATKSKPCLTLFLTNFWWAKNLSLLSSRLTSTSSEFATSLTNLH